ncbi:MAG: hypothetical protein OCD01_04215 [Fibrobacterales bacterium]
MRISTLLTFLILLSASVIADDFQYDLSKHFGKEWSLNHDKKEVDSSHRSLKSYFNSVLRDTTHDNIEAQVVLTKQLSAIIIHAASPIFLGSSKQTSNHKNDFASCHAGFMEIDSSYINRHTIKLIEAFNSEMLYYLLHIDDCKVSKLQLISESIYSEPLNKILRRIKNP